MCRFVQCLVIVLGLVFASCSIEDKIRIIRKDKELLLAKGKNEQNTISNCLKPKEFFIDNDKDGYGGNKKIKACKQKSGLSSIGGDCDDNDPRVFPGQKDFFATPRKNGSFDFDCDGKEKKRLVSRAFCMVKDDGKGCINSSGWAIPATKPIPKCGEPEEWEWTECRKTIIEKNSQTGDASKLGDATSVTPMIPPMGIVEPKVKEIYSCWSGKLKWKKRQLCR